MGKRKPRKSPKVKTGDWRDKLPESAYKNAVISEFNMTAPAKKKNDIYCPHFWEFKPWNGCRFQCQWCVDGQTMIMMADLSWKQINTLKVGNDIMGFVHGGSTKLKPTKIEAIRKVTKPRLKLTTNIGEIICSFDHRFLSREGRWATAKHLATAEGGIKYITLPSERTPENVAYMAGYLHGITDGDGTMGSYEYKTSSIHSYRLAMKDEEPILRSIKYFDVFGIKMNRFVYTHKSGFTKGKDYKLHAIRKAGIDNYNKILDIFKTYAEFRDYDVGYVAGMFDAEGSRCKNTIRISNKDINKLDKIKITLSTHGFKTRIEKQHDCTTLRILNNERGSGPKPSADINDVLRFFNIFNPCIKRKWPDETTIKLHVTDPVSKTERLEPGELFDIQTGTETFIANGLASHNCFLNGTYRFNENGPAPVMKEKDRVIKALERVLEAANTPILFNAGEVGDGMLYPSFLLADIIPAFKKYPQHKILILTKDASEGAYRVVRSANAQKQVVFAWSINATRVAEDYELYASPPKERLALSRLASDLGYETRLRLDPMVPVTGWKEAYSHIIKEICRMNPKASVITLGSLRGLQSTILACRKNGRDMSWTEYLTESSNWGLRPAPALCAEMYEHAIKELRKNGYKGEITLCKETLEVWKILKDRKVIDYGPGEKRCNCTLK